MRERVENTPTPDSRLPTPSLSVAFVTVGDTSRLTGGYLYHARLFDRLGEHGVEVEEVVPSGASADEQKGGVSKLAAFDPRGFDVIVVDALARVAAAPFIEKWREHRPVVAMVHELPSLASPEDDIESERAFEDALLGADMFIAVSAHGKAILEGRGAPSGRIRIVEPGFDGFTSNPGSREPGEARSDSALRSGSLRGGDPMRGAHRYACDAETPSSAGETFDRTKRANEGSGGSAGFPVGIGGAGGRASAGSGHIRAICVAQWIPRKGILELVEAWRSLEAPNAVLELVGETDADPEYRSRVMEAIGGNPSISVSETLDDDALFAAYTDSDFFVLPSRYEGYGVVYAEALSFGLPVVACDVGPVPEVVGREAGIFASPGDVPGISDAMHTLLSDGRLRRRMSDAALRRVENLPRWDDTARGFAEVLWEAAGRG